MINKPFVLELQNMDTDDMWFQQDGTTCHTTQETIRLFQKSFTVCVISRIVITITRPGPAI